MFRKIVITQKIFILEFAPDVYGLSSKVFGSDELISLFSEDDMRLSSLPYKELPYHPNR